MRDAFLCAMPKLINLSVRRYRNTFILLINIYMFWNQTNFVPIIREIKTTTIIKWEEKKSFLFSKRKLEYSVFGVRCSCIPSLKIKSQLLFAFCDQKSIDFMKGNVVSLTRIISKCSIIVSRHFGHFNLNFTHESLF